MEKIAFVSLGCSKNLIDTEVMLGILKDKHMGMTDDPSQADIILGHRFMGPNLGSRYGG